MPDLSISPDDYARFINNIELRSIWVSEASIRNEHGLQLPEQMSIDIRSESKWSDSSDGFIAEHHYVVEFETDDTIAAEIRVTFSAAFTSAESMTDDIFTVFQDINLPVNTWPYLREFVSSMLGRINWLPFTLPALKRGAEPSSEDSTDSKPRKARTRRKVSESS